MIRVVAGQAGGRRLGVPIGPGTRPTADRTREALFATLESLRGPLPGARVLDLYAGSGALGLEALSRGAAAVLLVEADPVALRVLRRNIEAVGLAGAEVRPGRVERVVGRRRDGAAYDVCLADPPYALPGSDLLEVLAPLPGLGWLTTESVVVVERSSRDPELDWPAGWSALRSRRYGEATLWYGRPS